MKQINKTTVNNCQHSSVCNCQVSCLQSYNHEAQRIWNADSIYTFYYDHNNLDVVLLHDIGARSELRLEEAPSGWRSGCWRRCSCRWWGRRGCPSSTSPIIGESELPQPISPSLAISPPAILQPTWAESISLGRGIDSATTIDLVG